MNLTRLALNRPVLVFVTMLSLILAGFIAFRSMRVELQPEVNFGVVTVTTTYPGAGPDDINELISRRIEEAVSGVNGIREVTSNSQEGVSVVTVQLELETNVDTALSDVRTKVDAIVNNLPEDAKKPVVNKFDNSSTPVMYLSLAGQGLSSRDLRTLVDDKILDRFAQLPGVAQASVSGGDVREIQVRLSKAKLLEYGLGIADVQRAVQAASINAPAGRFVQGDLEYTVRVKSDFTSVEDVRKTILNVRDSTQPNSVARQVRLTDIADVKDAIVERTSYSRLNGKDSLVIALSKAREGNAVQISDAARGNIQKLEKEFPIKATITYDAAKEIRNSLDDVEFTLLFSIFLVSTVVFVFLHDWRGTLIVAFAIPSALVGSFILMKAAGFTVNNLTMLALILAVAVLVDDAIVVLENIYRHLKKGEDPRDAALNGRGEIGIAAIAITLADVVVFLPIAFTGGIVGQFFKPLALGYVFAVIISLFISFTLTPLLAARWYRAGEDVEHSGGRFGRWFDRGFARFETAYGRALEWSLHHRWFVFIAGNVSLLVIAMFIAGSFLGKGGKVGNIFKFGPQGPPPPIALLQFAFFIGLIVYVVNALKKYDKPFLTTRISLGLGFAGATFAALAIVKAVPIGIFLAVVGAVLVATLKADRMNRSVLGGLAIAAVAALASGTPMPVLGLSMAAVFLPWFLFFLFLAITGKPKAKGRYLTNALAFGALFPLAAIGGSLYSGWKREDVFKFTFIPQADGTQINATIEMPVGTSLERTQQVVEQIERQFIADPNVEFTLSTLGAQPQGGRQGVPNQGSNYAGVQATLYDRGAFLDRVKRLLPGHKDEKLRWIPAEEVSADLLKKVGRIPGAQITIATAGGFSFGSPIQLSLTSDDHEKLLATAQKVRDGLAGGAVAGVINPEVSSKAGKPELRIVPDRLALADAGLDPTALGSAVRTLYQGDNRTKLRIQGREYDVRVLLDYADRDDPNTLTTVPITFVSGAPVFLSSVATIRQVPGLTRITRRDRSEEIVVTADLLPGYEAGTANAAVTTWLQGQHIPPEGVRLRALGQADSQAREQGGLILAFVSGLVLVYLVLASLYNNWLYPFIIQLAQPQAIVGAMLALIITNKAFSLFGFIGLVTLIGLVGKNAILLVDYTNTLRERGRNRHDAIVEAGPTRLRPISMTTIALLIGVSPIALAIGRGSESRETIGITIIGGISLSTLLTLFVIPCSYTIFDDLSNLISRARKQPLAFGGPEGHLGTEEPPADPVTDAGTAVG